MGDTVITIIVFTLFLLNKCVKLFLNVAKMGKVPVISNNNYHDTEQ